MTYLLASHTIEQRIHRQLIISVIINRCTSFPLGFASSLLSFFFMPLTLIIPATHSHDHEQEPSTPPVFLRTDLDLVQEEEKSGGDLPQ